MKYQAMEGAKASRFCFSSFLASLTWPTLLPIASWFFWSVIFGFDPALFFFFPCVYGVIS